MKASLEALPSVITVDVHRFGPLGNGKYRWDIYFRSERGDLPMITANGELLTGTGAKVYVSELQKGNLKSLTGASPRLKNEEKVAGLPSYTGFYVPQKTTNYTMAVRQLQSGGLFGQYFDNQWFMHSPVVTRVDPTLNFNWGTDKITPHGRDYVSVRWTGKLRSYNISEAYTFFLSSDDGARLYIDHVKVIDSWEQTEPIEQRAIVNLKAGTYHDIKVEYKDERNAAFIQLQWSSFSIQKEIIPPSHFYQASHIVGSPFVTAIIPGSSDYPYTTAYGPGLLTPVAGIAAKFTIQAKDLFGNNKTSEGRDTASTHLDGYDSFSVDLTGPNSEYLSVTPKYIGGGAYSCEYIPSQSGPYRIDIVLAGTHIYCGAGSQKSCSPFKVHVQPGLTTHETSVATGIGLTDVVAGEIAQFTIQAKDAYDNNKTSGGEQDRFTVELILDTSANSIVRGPNTTIEDAVYRGKVQDFNDGTGRYLVTYTAYRQGKYTLKVQYDGLQILTAASAGIQGGESPAIPIPLIVHSLLHPPSSTATGPGLYNAVANIPDYFTIHAKDAFANDRRGDRTPNDNLGSGQGNDDSFLITLKGPGDTEYVTSSAVVNFEIGHANAMSGVFSVTYDGKTTPNLPWNTDAASLQSALEYLHIPNPRSVQISRFKSSKTNGYKWSVTFTSHLELYHPNKFSVNTANIVPSISAIISTPAKNGAYPCSYTAWTKGSYEVHITSRGVHIESSPFSLTVHDGAVHPETSTAFGKGLMDGIAGVPHVFTVQAKDTRAYEQQTITTSAIAVPIVPEQQQILCSTFVTGTKQFKLAFRGQATGWLNHNVLPSAIKSALEQLKTVTTVTVTHSNGDAACDNGGFMMVQFDTERHDLPALVMTTRASVNPFTEDAPTAYNEVIKGSAPYRKEVQSLTCPNENNGIFRLKFEKDGVATGVESGDIDKTTTLSQLKTLLSNIPYIDSVSVEKFSVSTTVCDGNATYITFDLSFGNVKELVVVKSTFTTTPVISEFIPGVHPLWGTFQLSFRGMITDDIPFDATAALEISTLSPNKLS